MNFFRFKIVDSRFLYEFKCLNCLKIETIFLFEFKIEAKYLLRFHFHLTFESLYDIITVYVVQSLKGYLVFDRHVTKKYFSLVLIDNK